MKKSKLKVLLTISFTSLTLLSTPLFLTSCEGFNNGNSNVNVDIEKIKLEIKNELNKVESNPLKVDSSQKININDVSKDNIKNYLLNFPEPSNDIKCEVDKIDKDLENGIVTVKLKFSKSSEYEILTQQVTGFEPWINHEKIINDAVTKLENNPITINSDGKKTLISDVTKENIKNYINNFPSDTNNLNIEILSVEALEYGNMKLIISFTSGNQSKDIESIISGFKFKASPLTESKPNHDVILSNAINNLKSNPLKLKDNAKNVLITTINENNIIDYLDNFPQKNKNLEAKIINFENNNKNIQFKINFISGNKSKESELQTIIGFALPLVPIRPQPIQISTPTLSNPNHVGPDNKDNEIKTRQYELNGFENSFKRIETELKANNKKQVNVFYNLAYLAVLHKYSIFAHLLKMSELLETYENLNIHLFVDSGLDFLKESNFKLDTVKAKFPRIKFSFLEENKSSEEILKTSEFYGSKLLKRTIEEINRNNLNDYENNSNYLFIDDMTFIDPFRRKKNENSSVKIDNFINNILPLVNFKEINVIADGTSSAAQYDNSMYDFYKTNPYLTFNRTTKKYENANTLLNEVVWNYRNMNQEYLINWLKNDHNRVDNIFASLLSSNNGAKTNLTNSSVLSNLETPTVRFFQASVNLAKDVNNTTSSILSNNDSNNEYFDPYNTESLNIIDFFQILSDESKKLFAEIFKFNSIDSYEKEFENKLNYIYGGGYMYVGDPESDGSEDTFFIEQEAKKVIKIHDDLTSKNSQSNKNFKIWFKAHPREKEPYKDKLKETIKNVLKDNSSKSESVINSLDFLDNQIPLEYFVMTGLFTPNSDKNKEVQCQTGYSTFALSVLDSKDNKDIIQKIVLDPENSDIVSRFGVHHTDQSKSLSLCFPKEKIEYTTK